ncbi:MAG: hypothetical protein HKO13_06345 [Sphingomonas sp.]|nr:hypothetical protein [Sphingomonas sp.]RZV46199.1 MAG: hypothetical protein EX258_10025 [Sphingomonadaceae bacterium]
MRIFPTLAAASAIAACSSESSDDLPDGNSVAIANDCLENYDEQLVTSGEGPFAVTATLRFEDSELSPIDWLQARGETPVVFTAHKGGNGDDTFEAFKANTKRFPAVYSSDDISAVTIDLGALPREEVRKTVCALEIDDIKLDSVTSRMTN